MLLLLLTSCSTNVEIQNKYPRYTLVKIEMIPDSLKSEYITYITETVRAANQHLSAGDYEDIENTIYAAERVANRIYEVSVMGLRKEIDKEYYNDFFLLPSEMNPNELEIFNNLKN